MTKKLQAPTKADDRQLAEAVRTSAQQIWRAGLGAFAKAQQEGGKVFAKLVQEGTTLQQRTQQLAGDKVAGMTGTVTKMADSVSKQASGSWDKLEQVFDDRVARSLSSLGVPTQKDLRQLTRRVEELSKTVATLTGTGPAAKTSKAAKPVTRTARQVAAKNNNEAAPKSSPRARKPAVKKAAKPTAEKAPQG